MKTCPSIIVLMSSVLNLETDCNQCFNFIRFAKMWPPPTAKTKRLRNANPVFKRSATRSPLLSTLQPQPQSAKKFHPQLVLISLNRSARTSLCPLRSRSTLTSASPSRRRSAVKSGKTSASRSPRRVAQTSGLTKWPGSPQRSARMSSIVRSHMGTRATLPSALPYPSAGLSRNGWTSQHGNLFVWTFWLMNARRYRIPVVTGSRIPAVSVNLSALIGTLPRKSAKMLPSQVYFCLLKL